MAQQPLRDDGDVGHQQSPVRYLDLQHSKLVEHSDGSGSLHDNFGRTDIPLNREERMQLVSKLPALREQVQSVDVTQVDPAAIQSGPKGESRYQSLLERIVLPRSNSQLRLVVSASLSSQGQIEIRSYLRMFKQALWGNQVYIPTRQGVRFCPFVDFKNWTLCEQVKEIKSI